ncbi:MAG TPA: response regulator [Polyangiaceae bacterium]|nr:response regulator [Polyangiaceae bacterium]
MSARVKPASGKPSIRVVVIDDDDFEREFVVDLLKRAGHFNVSSMSSVFGLTNHLINEQVEVVVLDVMMPSIRGDKLAALLRKSPALAKLGVVLMSSLPESELAALMAEVEVDAFVPKANLRTELAAVIRSVAARA